MLTPFSMQVESSTHRAALQQESAYLSSGEKKQAPALRRGRVLRLAPEGGEGGWRQTGGIVELVFENSVKRVLKELHQSLASLLKRNRPRRNAGAVFCCLTPRREGRVAPDRWDCRDHA